MSAPSDLVCLLEQGRKGIVELRCTRYPKLMDPIRPDAGLPVDAINRSRILVSAPRT